MVAFTAHLHCNQFYSKRSLRDYNKGDYDAINSALAQVAWDGLLNDNTSVCWQRFWELLLNLEDHVPLKTVFVSQGIESLSGCLMKL